MLKKLKLLLFVEIIGLMVCGIGNIGYLIFDKPFDYYIYLVIPIIILLAILIVYYILEPLANFLKI